MARPSKCGKGQPNSSRFWMIVMRQHAYAAHPIPAGSLPALTTLPIHAVLPTQVSVYSAAWILALIGGAYVGFGAIDGRLSRLVTDNLRRTRLRCLRHGIARGSTLAFTGWRYSPWRLGCCTSLDRCDAPEMIPSGLRCNRFCGRSWSLPRLVAFVAWTSARSATSIRQAILGP